MFEFFRDYEPFKILPFELVVFMVFSDLCMLFAGLKVVPDTTEFIAIFYC